MDKELLHKKLAEIMVAKLRDENYDSYIKTKEHARSMSLTEYENTKKNPNLDQDLQKLRDERFKFLNSLNEEQIKVLDRLILGSLDNTAFNFLREMEENLCQCEGRPVGLTIDGKNLESIQDELLSGTLFGEYFLWVEENSKYGPFQH